MDFIYKLTDYLHNRIILEKAFRIVAIILIGLLLISTVRLLIVKIIQKKANPQVKMVTKKIINYSGFSILIFIIFSECGLELSALLGAAGVFGIAIGIASQKSLGNIISGFFLVSEKSFEIDDVIKVGERVGVVHSVELLSIMLRTFDNMLIRIPNEEMISTDFINITKYPIRRMDLSIQVSYKDDLKVVMNVLENTAKNNPYCLDEPEPFILLKELGESGINIQYGVWFDKNDYKDTKNSLIIDIIDNFREAGITIPYKHITIETNSDISSVLDPPRTK
jgi:small-conductance mechanosensitive channel